MLTIAYYFLQVILCSGIMMGYYWLVLRNKRFHQYNRFYLLVIALLSWVVPLIKIRLQQPVVNPAQQVMQFFTIVANNNTRIEQAIGTTQSFEWSWRLFAGCIYFSVSVILLFAMARALYRLYHLLKTHSCMSVGEIYLIMTQAKGTPFSFFRYIFWNEAIDLRSEAGKQILQHELTHVHQKHSIDKLFINLILVFGWFNPFFWLLRKEMDMIHEFIADKKAVGNGDTASLAQMLLTAAYPQQPFALTNPFFFSPIKRRLQMLTNNQHPRFSYIRRLVVLPLLAIVVLFFAFRSDEQREKGLSLASAVENAVEAISDKIAPSKNKKISIFNRALLDRIYTVVIDAGHGGKDKGITAADGTTESELTLQLAKAIKETNFNPEIRILLTRESDQFHSTRQIADFANKQHADLFVSLHGNQSAKASLKTSSGIELYIPSPEKAVDYRGSEALAEAVANELNKLNGTLLGITSRNYGGDVLRAVKSPAILIEAGFMNNKNDLDKLKDAAYRKQLADALLQGINEYLANIAQHNFTPGKMSAGGKRIDTIVQSPDTLKLSSIFSNKLFVLDGKKVDNSILELLDPSKIDNIRVLKGQEATTLYGEEGKNGVVLIKSKITKTTFTADTIITHGNFDGATFSVTASGTKKPQVSMSFDDSGWIANDGKRHPFSPQPLYIVNGSKPTAKTGTLRIDDIISINILSGKDATDKYGSEGKNGVIEITTKPDTDVNDNPTTTATSVPIATYITAKTIPSPAVNVSNASLVSYPDLTNDLSKKYPAVIKSHLAVKAGYVGVKMSSASPQDDVSAHFPGGSEAWVKYLERNINRNILIKNGAPPGKYKVIVSFDVDMNGELTNIRAETDPGYGTKDEAIRLIAKGPKWIPATKDGKAIATNHKQAISFVRSEPK